MTEKTETTQPTAEAQQAAVDLTVQDLAGLRAVIDVASTRGAFKAAELEAVGKLFNKLNSFLEAVAKSQPQPEAPEQGKE
jgi:hypothetical protein